jgi:signal recognition particle receptor subunit beta
MSRDYLRKIHSNLQPIPILVLANKYDLIDALSPSEIAQKLELQVEQKT